MKPAAFDYVAPTSVELVLELLDRHGDEARVIAGGQSLVPMMAFRLSRPAVLVDLNRVAGLSGVTGAAGTLKVGAMTRQAEVLRNTVVAERLPGLAAATRLVGHHQTRNRGTIGGSIALADPAAENPAFALALDAGIELRSQRGTRVVPASQFFAGAYVTAIQPDEIITSIAYPLWGNGTTIAVDEVMRRPGDFALVGLTVAIQRDLAGRIGRAGIAWFGLSTEPSRATALERALIGQAAAGVDIAAMADLALADVEPKDDVQATSAYRRKAGLALAARVLRGVLSA